MSSPDPKFAWEPGGRISAGVRSGAVFVELEGEKGHLAVTMLPETAEAFAAHILACSEEARKSVIQET